MICVCGGGGGGGGGVAGGGGKVSWGIGGIGLQNVKT